MAAIPQLVRDGQNPPQPPPKSFTLSQVEDCGKSGKHVEVSDVKSLLLLFWGLVLLFKTRTA